MIKSSSKSVIWMLTINSLLGILVLLQYNEKIDLQKKLTVREERLKETINIIRLNPQLCLSIQGKKGNRLNGSSLMQEVNRVASEMKVSRLIHSVIPSEDDKKMVFTLRLYIRGITLNEAVNLNEGLHRIHPEIREVSCDLSREAQSPLLWALSLEISAPQYIFSTKS